MPQMRQLTPALGQRTAGFPVGDAPALHGHANRFPTSAYRNCGQRGGRLRLLGVVQQGERIERKNTSGISKLRANGISHIESRIPFGGGLQSFADQCGAKQRQAGVELHVEGNRHMHLNAREPPKSLAHRLQ